MKLLSICLVMVLAVLPAAALAQDRPGLPLGDGHVTDNPAAGNVFACQTLFRDGARHDGPWFHGVTWNPLEKPQVEGRVMWPDARLSVTDQGDARRVEGNGLPVGQPTGRFPITPDQPAYQYDTNPNAIAGHDLDFTIPATPVRAEAATCLPMGMVGFSVTGVAFYNALDASGRDAAAHEIQDLCDGHPQGQGQYHYHSGSRCLPGHDSDAVVGWALDGYPILGMRDVSGRVLTNADLDDCHGRAETVSVAGRTYDYAYRLTAGYPYVIGCFVGSVPEGLSASIRRSLGPPRRAGRRPPA